MYVFIYFSVDRCLYTFVVIVPFYVITCLLLYMYVFYINVFFYEANKDYHY